MSLIDLKIIFLFRKYAVPLLLVTFLALSGCAFETQSHMMRSPVELHKNIVRNIMPASDLTSSHIEMIAENYRRQGDGVIEAQVFYNARSSSHGMHWASKKADYINKELSMKGVEHVVSDIVPVKDIASPRVLIRYQSYEARPPRECEGRIYEARMNDPDPNYRIGCTTANFFSQQIYQSRDLKDRTSDMGDQNADRASTAIDAYRQGLRNQTLEGDSTTDFTDDGG